MKFIIAVFLLSICSLSYAQPETIAVVNSKIGEMRTTMRNVSNRVTSVCSEDYERFEISEDYKAEQILLMQQDMATLATQYNELVDMINALILEISSIGGE